MIPLLLFLHIVSVVIWVGGMFFAYVCLRPIAAQQLAPALRLPLWAGVFSRFFPWIWAAVALILLSGFTMISSAGFGNAPWNWHLMMTIGLLMSGIFAYVFFVPFAELKRLVSAQDWSAGAVALSRIRQLVGINLFLGIINVAVATIGELA